MSDYPMLISNKLHSFRNFQAQTYEANKIKVFNDRSAYHSFHQLYGQRA